MAKKGSATSSGSEQGSKRRAGVRLATAVSLGLLSGTIVASFGHPAIGSLVGWLVTATVYSTWVWANIARLGPDETKSHATQQDPSRGTADLLLVIAAVGSLASVGMVLVAASRKHGGGKVGLVALGLAAVVASWTVVHTVYTLHYARLYYSDDPGGIDFNEDAPPRYMDFAYLAFTIGMTFQVSDTNIQLKVIRSAALRHALLSYLFGAGILATTVNLVAGLSK